MKNNRFVKAVALCCAALTLVAGCQNAESASAPAKSPTGTNISMAEDTIDIVCTVFPVYDWVREIIRGQENRFNLTLLLDNGVDMHSYQPTAEDMVRIGSGDLFIYIGGESEGWVDDALEEMGSDNLAVLKLMDVLGDRLLEEELKEGMQDTWEHDHDEEHDDDHNHDDDHDHDDEGAGASDEHIWLSVKNAAILVDAIEEAIGIADKDNKDIYAANSGEYIDRLELLDKAYSETAKAASVKAVLFGDRFPFRYLMEDYNLDYYAAFPGCSAETEASFNTVTFLADKMDELQLKNIATLEGSDGRLAATILSNTASSKGQVVVFDSIQSISAEDIDKGITYISIMEKNLEAFRTSLE